MIHLKIKTKTNGRKEVISMQLVAFFRDCAVVKGNSQHYLYQFDRQKLIPLSESATAVYLTKHIIPPYQM